MTEKCETRESEGLSSTDPLLVELMPQEKEIQFPLLTSLLTANIQRRLQNLTTYSIICQTQLFILKYTI
jgi:hypothetical protein